MTEINGKNPDMNSPLPRPALDAALAELGTNDNFRAVLHFIRDERERFLGDFRQAESSNDVMKIAGSIATLDELLANITPQVSVQ